MEPPKKPTDDEAKAVIEPRPPSKAVIHIPHESDFRYGREHPDDAYMASPYDGMARRKELNDIQLRSR